MTYLEMLWTSFFESLPNVFSAILLLILALIVAYLAKRVVTKLLKLVNVDKHTEKIGLADEATGSSVEFIGKLVFLIVFLLFLPGVLDKLGMQNVSAPITSMVSQFLNYIPNILAAIVILVVGLFIAKLIRQLLTPILKRLNVDKIQEKAGISTTENTTVSSVISYLVYVLILIPVIIAALQVLNISAISEPAIAMLDKIILFLPNIFVAIAIIIIGLFVSKIAGKLLTEILAGVGTDRLLEKLVPEDKTKLKSFSLSKGIGDLVKYILILLFFVEAINVLRLQVLQAVGAAIIAYLPLVISAIIIMGVALFVANWVESLLLKRFTDLKIVAFVVKAAIITLAVFMTLNQLGIATSIVNAAFIIVLGAVAVAFAISFGVGGRDVASNILQVLQKKHCPECADDANVETEVVE